ncbi:MAG: hypothetical protein AVDCRST_MAG18-930, partial [uncultured Thermomicrobiales bacterium]
GTAGERAACAGGTKSAPADHRGGVPSGDGPAIGARTTGPLRRQPPGRARGDQAARRARDHRHQFGPGGGRRLGYDQPGARRPGAGLLPGARQRRGYPQHPDAAGAGDRGDGGDPGDPAPDAPDQQRHPRARWRVRRQRGSAGAARRSLVHDRRALPRPAGGGEPEPGPGDPRRGDRRHPLAAAEERAQLPSRSGARTRPGAAPRHRRRRCRARPRGGPSGHGRASQINARGVDAVPRRLAEHDRCDDRGRPCL